MMKNFYKTLFIALLFVPVLGISFDAQGALAQTETTTRASTDPCTAQGFVPGDAKWRKCDREQNPGVYKSLTADSPGFWSGIFRDLIATIGTIFLQVTGFFLGLAGSILNGVVYYTIYKVADNYSNLTPILETWRVIRDLANMSFIFVLLYAGIKTMLGDGGETRKIIVGVVIAAILMNFSLFFTRLVIDAANIFALTFYKAIVPNLGDGFLTWGISNAFMEHLRLQSLYQLSGTTSVSWDTILTVGIMGSIMLLVASFAFLAIAIMFIIRYIILLLVMILSPVFFLASAFPKSMGLEKYATQWKDALFGQAFFAPVFFLLIWISLRVMEGVFKALNPASAGLTKGAFGGIAIAGTPPASTLVMFINFAMVIALILASLSVAKQMANKAGGGLSKATDWATGKAGSLTFGAAGTLGRGTVGRAGQALGENEKLKAIAVKGGATGFIARQSLQGGRKVGSATFDARGAGLGGKDAGKVANKGGYAGYVKDKVKQEEEFAKSLGPSDKTKIKADNELTFLKEQDKIVRANAEEYVNETFRKPAQLENLERDIATAEAQSRNMTMTEAGRATAAQRAAELKTQAKPISENYERQRKEMLEREIAKSGVAVRLSEAQSKADSLKGVDDKRAKEILENQGFREKLKKEGRNKEEIDKAEKEMIAELKKKNPNAGESRKQAFANAVENSFYAKWVRGYNYAAASKIRKGKSPQEEATEALKKLAKADGLDTGEKPEGEKSAGGEGEEKKEGGESKPAA